MKKSKLLPMVTALGMVTSIAIAVPAFAQTNLGVSVGLGAGNNGKGHLGIAAVIHNGANGGVMLPGVFGTVTAVSGNTLTVTSKMFKMGPRGAGDNASATTTATVYTVDATNAKIYKDNATSTISGIAVNDMVIVEGAVSGTNVAATVIRDGMMFRGGMPPGEKGFMHSTSTVSSTFPITGNGQPVVAGSVTAITSSTITITNASNVTYTIDGVGAKIVRGDTVLALSNIVIGDNVVVQGAVNGNTVTASSIIVGGFSDRLHMGNRSSTTSTVAVSGGLHLGFFIGIGNFFKHLFGF
jgi:hypothetical protein